MKPLLPAPEMPRLSSRTVILNMNPLKHTLTVALALSLVAPAAAQQENKHRDKKKQKPQHAQEMRQKRKPKQADKPVSGRKKAKAAPKRQMAKPIKVQRVRTQVRRTIKAKAIRTQVRRPVKAQAIRTQVRRTTAVRKAILSKRMPQLPRRGARPVAYSARPVRTAGYPSISRYIRPKLQISTRNYPRPNWGTSYLSASLQLTNRNYQYDSARFQPRVSRFYGNQNSQWGNRWRYGYAPSTTFRIGFGTNFGFGFYVYTPFYVSSVPSPYYYNSYVPAYLPRQRVTIWPSYQNDWNYGDNYDYQSSNRYDSYGDHQFNYGISTFSLSYRDRNVNVIADFMGQGEVAVFSEGHYQYSLRSDDFRQMMSDNLRASRTVGFDVLSVRHRGNSGIGRFRQRYNGQDGRQHVIYITIRLQRAGDRYAITDYMTSERPY